MKRKSKYKTNATIKDETNYFTWTYKLGRWAKRRLSKARRKYHKDLLRHGKGKEPTGIESETNYKYW